MEVPVAKGGCICILLSQLDSVEFLWDWCQEATLPTAECSLAGGREHGLSLHRHLPWAGFLEQAQGRLSLCSFSNQTIVVQVAFDGIGSMPMARIENYRQVKQEAVEFEMKRRNARKNLDHALVTSPQDSRVMQVEGETYM